MAARKSLPQRQMEQRTGDVKVDTAGVMTTRHLSFSRARELESKLFLLVYCIHILNKQCSVSFLFFCDFGPTIPLGHQICVQLRKVCRCLICLDCCFQSLSKQVFEYLASLESHASVIQETQMSNGAEKMVMPWYNACLGLSERYGSLAKSSISFTVPLANLINVQFGINVQKCPQCTKCDITR